MIKYKEQSNLYWMPSQEHSNNKLEKTQQEKQTMKEKRKNKELEPHTTKGERNKKAQMDKKILLQRNSNKNKSQEANQN